MNHKRIMHLISIWLVIFAISTLLPQTITQAHAQNLGGGANAITDTVTGERVDIHNVSSIEHEMQVKVRGKNLLPYPYYESTITKNGITFTDNGDGSITANGTATADAKFLCSTSKVNVINVEPGSLITLSGCPADGSYNNYQLKLQSTNYKQDINDKGYGATQTAIYDKYYLMIYVCKGSTVKNLVFTPTVTVNSQDITLYKHGKNLVPYPFYESTATKNGITFRDNKDGSVTVTGTATADAKFLCSTSKINTIEIGKGNAVTLSGCPNGGSTSTYMLTLQSTNYKQSITDCGEGITKNTNYDDYYVMIIIKAGTVANNLRFWPMVSVDSTDAYYVPYVKPQKYSVAEDGTVSGVNSVYPTTSLTTDTEGAIIECTYQKDTGKAISQATSLDFPIITFIDDDGLYDSLATWEDLSDATGIKPTIALVTHRMTEDDANSIYASWEQVKRLENKGFEFISHSDGHIKLSGADDETIHQDLSSAVNAFQEHDITPRFLVYPYNATNDRVISIVKQYFTAAICGENLTQYSPLDNFRIKRQSVTINGLVDKEFEDGSSRSVYEYRSEEELKAIIDDAAKYNGWVIFMTHLRNRDTFYYNDEIKNRMINVCEYAALKGCKFMTFGDAYDLRKNQFESQRFVVDYSGTIHTKNL